ncbi:MAG: ABC transporter ATP-binding protein [Myxococcota bacterium]
MSALTRFARTYGTPYLPWYIAGAVALTVTNGLSVTIPLYLAEGIDALGHGLDARPIVLRSAAIVAAMGTAVIGIRTASRLLFFTPGRLIEARIQHDLFAKILEQQPEFFARHPQGDLTSRFTSDVMNARLLFGFTALGIVNTASAAVLAGLQLVKLSPALGLLAAVPLGLAFLATTVAVDRMRDLMRQNQQRLAWVSEHALTSFQGIAAVHAFGAAGALTRVFREHNEAIGRNQIARSGLRVAIGPLLGLAASLDVFLALWLGGPGGLVGHLTAGEIVAFAAIVAYLVAPLRTLTFTLSVVRQSTASLERLDAVLSTVPHRPDRADGPGAPAPTAPPAISLRSLSYRYPGSDRDALREVSVDVPSGGVLGVFGPTGSGKSTLVRCLLRLDDPPPGAVWIDGTDVRSIDLDRWRRAVALVPQRAFLFSESVRDNILLGSDPARLDALIDAAQLRVDVAALPDGLDTVVGESGLTLSGGQRQRVALARGLGRDAVVLVLDDVLSAVDPTTESALIRNLRQRAGCPTTVIVSNRVSALRHADVIVVLEDGAGVDRGTHAELVRRPGPYHDAAERQEDRG